MRFFELGDLLEDFEIDERELEIYTTTYLEAVLGNLQMVTDDLRSEVEARLEAEDEEEPVEEY